MNLLLRLATASALLAGLAACAPAGYVVRSPAPSGLKLAQAPAAPATLALVDAREGAERTFSSGVLPMGLSTAEGPVDPVVFLANALDAELKSRGEALSVSRDGTAEPRFKVKAFRMQNHRTNAYTPFITFTFLSGDLEAGGAPQRLAVFVKRGKVPVWSFNEVVDPTLNDPLTITVRELAAKIADRLYGHRASDADVDALIAKVTGASSDTRWFDVYALGFSNNPRAIPTLASLTKDGDEYVRLAAVSGLGMLKAVDHYAALKAIYTGAEQWQDRAMAIKAIGDLNTAEGNAFLDAELKRWEAQGGDKEAQWTAQVIRLYR